MTRLALSLSGVLLGTALTFALAPSEALASATGGSEPPSVPSRERPRDRLEPLPKRLEGIDIIERLDGAVPEKLAFTDENGRAVLLGDYFRGDVPVILTLNYSNCPMLCSVQLNGLVKGLQDLEWTPGQQFRIVTVSLDPAETHQTAHKTQTKYLAQYGRPEAISGWHFLTGSEANIRELAQTLGFQYGYNEVRKEYVHAAAIVVATPAARIARYLYGVEYAEKTLRLSLVEASEGKIGSSLDRLILYCFYYDSSEGRYAPMARNIMKAGGALASVALGGFDRLVAW